MACDTARASTRTRVRFQPEKGSRSSWSAFHMQDQCWDNTLDRSMMETGFGDNVMEVVFVHSLSAKRCQKDPKRCQKGTILLSLGVFLRHLSFADTLFTETICLWLRYDGTKMLGTWKAEAESAES